MTEMEITSVHRGCPPGWEPRALASTAVNNTRAQFTQAWGSHMYLLMQSSGLSLAAVEQLVNRTSEFPEPPTLPVTAIATEYMPLPTGPAAGQVTTEARAAFERVLDTFTLEGAVIVPLRPDGDDNVMTLGRSGQTNIPIKHASISKLHARFRYDDAGQLFVQESGSKNGTFVNGNRIPPDADLKLHNGDRMGWGKVRAFVVDASMLWRVLDRVAL